MNKLFNKKRTYIGNDGDEYINMSIPVVDVSAIHSNSIIRVNQDENGRLDNFVWKNVTKNMNMIDIVMYANHIFNPFSIQDGDLIYVPIDNDKVYKTSNEPFLPDGTKKSSVKNEKNMSYAEKINYIARKGLGIK